MAFVMRDCRRASMPMLVVLSLLVWVLLPMVPSADAASGDVPVDTDVPMRIRPPLPVWPSDYETITERRPVFRLNGRYGATRYRVEIDRSATFESPIVIERTQTADNGGIAPAVVAPYTGEALADGQYYWRAFAGDDSGYWTPAANHRTFFVASRDVDAIEVPAEFAHPYLVMSASEVPSFLERAATSPRIGPGWNYIRNAAYSMLDATPPDENYAHNASGQHGNYSVVAHWYHRHLSNVAFVALVTGDARLTDKGVDMLMAACDYSRWLGPLFDNPEHFNPPWRAALETAMMTTAVATGYDLLHESLTPEQREHVREVLIRNGVRPLIEDWVDPVTASRLPRHQLPTGNWVMVCATSAGVGALAVLDEEPEAPHWVRLTRNRVRAWLHDRGGDFFADNPWVKNRPTPIPVLGPSEANFDADGAYKESTTYMNYAMQYVCCFADGLRRATGDDLFEHFPENLLEQTAWTIMAWPEDGGVLSSVVPFGDCGTTAGFPLLYAALTRHKNDTLAAWLCERVVPIPQDVRSLVWLDEHVPGRPPDAAVPMKAFRTTGQVAMRRGWGPNTPMAAIKFRQNRGHHDIGTFYLFGGGSPTLIDSGPSGYGSEIYKKYSSQSIGHNLVLVDDKPQRRTDGEMLAAVGTSRLTAASGELSAAYPEDLSSWTRDLVMLPGDMAIVFDKLSADEPHDFDYVLHPYWPFRLPYPNASPGEVLIGDEPATRVSLHTEAPLTVSEEDGYYLTTPRKYLRFATTEPARHRTYLLLCEWPTSPVERRAVQVSAIGPGRWQVRRVGEDWRLMVRTGSNASERNRTDARLVAVWDQGERGRERHALVLGGRRLGVEHRELLRATRPVHAAIEFGEPLRAHVWSGEPVRLSLAVEPGADNLFVDGKPVRTVRRGEHVLIDLPAGESHVTATQMPRFVPPMHSIVMDDLLAVSMEAEAPAFQPGVRVLSSSCVPDGLCAIDGDANTTWHSLQGMPMPQWLEVRLPETERIGQVRIAAAPGKGRVETWDNAKDEYVTHREFITTADRPRATVSFEPVETDRLRVTITERTGGSTASVDTLEWSE